MATKRKAARKKCSGHSKRTGKPCGRWAMKNDTGKCASHGGKSLRGAESPSFVHGRYSTDLPEQLATRFAKTASDPELVDLRAEIALIDTRSGDLLSSLTAGGGVSAEAWKAANALYGELGAALAALARRGRHGVLGRAFQLIRLFARLAELADAAPDSAADFRQPSDAEDDEHHCQDKEHLGKAETKWANC